MDHEENVFADQTDGHETPDGEEEIDEEMDEEMDEVEAARQ